MDLNPFFESYRQLVGRVDETFNKVAESHPEQVCCGLGCSDCCYALFDLSLVEAMHIKDHFDREFTGDARTAVIERANKADRTVHRIKRQAYKAVVENGEPEEKIIAEMAEQRVRCPMLNDQEQCLIYSQRPITCRLYGIPTEIGGQAHTCGKSGFSQGQSYPTVKLEAIHKRLYEISAELAVSIGSRFPKLAEMLVPLSMALLTDYTEDYLGVSKKAEPGQQEKAAE